MRRIVATIFSVVAIAFVLFWISEAASIGAPWIFSLVGVVMIIFIALSLIRTWMRG
jgi:hypothetical protein